MTAGCRQQPSVLRTALSLGCKISLDEDFKRVTAVLFLDYLVDPILEHVKGPKIIEDPLSDPIWRFGVKGGHAGNMPKGWDRVGFHSYQPDQLRPQPSLARFEVVISLVVAHCGGAGAGGGMTRTKAGSSGNKMNVGCCRLVETRRNLPQLSE